MAPNQPGMPPRMPIPGVKNLIAVGSGKGGVGKTTVSVNLAVALASLGNKAGLMDADVYGPNVPLMMGINRTPMAHGERIQPLEQHGVRLMSMGFLNPGDKPLVWRGPRLSAVFISSDSLEYRQTLSLLRETYPKLPVIVVSRFPDVKQWLDALDAGANDYCGAPFERVQLHWILNSVLGWPERKASEPESEPLNEPILSPG